MAVKYHDLTKEYCKCSTAKIQTEFTQGEYIEIIKIGIEDKSKSYYQYFQAACRITKII